MVDQEKIERLVAAFYAVLRSKDSPRFTDDLCQSMTQQGWTSEEVSQLRKRLLEYPGAPQTH
jgi:hypothetical protein